MRIRQIEAVGKPLDAALSAQLILQFFDTRRDNDYIAIQRDQRLRIRVHRQATDYAVLDLKFGQQRKKPIQKIALVFRYQLRNSFAVTPKLLSQLEGVGK